MLRGALDDELLEPKSALSTKRPFPRRARTATGWRARGASILAVSRPLLHIARAGRGRGGRGLVVSSEPLEAGAASICGGFPGVPRVQHLLQLLGGRLGARPPLLSTG